MLNGVRILKTRLGGIIARSCKSNRKWTLSAQRSAVVESQRNEESGS